MLLRFGGSRICLVKNFPRKARVNPDDHKGPLGRSWVIIW